MAGADRMRGMGSYSITGVLFVDVVSLQRRSIIVIDDAPNELTDSKKILLKEISQRLDQVEQKLIARIDQREHTLLKKLRELFAYAA